MINMYRKLCKICGQDFSSSFPHAVYCSNKCRKEGAKSQVRKYLRLRYLTDNEFRRKTIENASKWNRENKERVNIRRKRKVVKFHLLDSDAKRRLITLVNPHQNKPKPKVGERCFVCLKKGKDKLIIHHINYQPNVVMITICKSCHAILHWIIREMEKQKRIREIVNWYEEVL